jgi:hypothetical protein
MGRKYRAHRHRDINNPILAAVGYNFRGLVKRYRILLRVFLAMLLAQPNFPSSGGKLTLDLRLIAGAILLEASASTFRS